MAFERGTEFTGGLGVKQSGDAASGSQTGVLGPPAVFYFSDPQTIDMADATFTAVTTIGSASQIKSGLLYVDPNSSGASEAFKLPPEADCKGWFLFITNTGGENITVQNDAAGAILTVSAGETGFFVCDGVTWKGASSGLGSITASVDEVNKYTLVVEIPDISTAQSVWVVAPHAGDITKIYTVIQNAITVADATITAEIAGVLVTGSSITIQQSGSAAGDVDSSTPSAANTVTPGQAIEIITDGGSTTACRCWVSIEIKR